MNKSIKKIFCFLLLFIVFIVMNLNCKAVVYADDDTAESTVSETDDNVVRVGYYKGYESFQAGFSDEERKSGYAYEYYQKISSITGWKYEYVYGTREEVLDMLLAGEVDIVAGIYKTDKRIEQVLFSKYDMGLDGEARYFVVNKDRTDLLDQLNYAQERILSLYPDFVMTLLQKYYSQNTKQLLTDKEREWLAKKGTLNIGYVKSNLPLSDQLGDGTPTGVVNDLILNVKPYLGIELNPVCYDNVTLMEEALLKGEIDIAFPIYSDIWITESKGFFQTEDFISDRVMVVYRGDYRDDLLNNIAISETGIMQNHYIYTHYPEANVTFYSTKEETYEAIEKGKADCMIGSSSVLQRFFDEHTEYTDYNISYLDAYENYCIGVNRNEYILVDILNKSLKQLSDTNIVNAMIQYSYVKPHYTFSYFIKRYAVVVILVLLIFSGTLLWVFINYRIKTYHFNEEQKKTHAALEDAFSVADAASKAKTVFLSNMSHDIRTPMNGIIGMTAIAEANMDNKEKVADCLTKINTSSKHLLALINDVLDMSKIETGEVALNERNFTMSSVIDELVTLNKPLADAKQHNMTVEAWDISHDKVLGDSVRIQQVFTNILSNAIKYTPNGGNINVTLIEKNSLINQKYCYEFVVQDNGIGMSEDFIPQIFESFSRANNTTASQIQGTGLGMAITKNIIRIMDGDIKVESRLGEGSKFTVILYLKAQDENALSEDVNTEAEDKQSDKGKGLKETTGQVDFNGKRALMAEDNEMNAEIAIEILGMTGLEVDWAHDGKEAVEKFEASEYGYYDCILMDIQMPVMNGLDAARKIRNLQNKDAKTIPIFALTANAFADDVQAIISAGMNEHISKPLNVEVLLGTIKKYISD